MTYDLKQHTFVQNNALGCLKIMLQTVKPRFAALKGVDQD